MSRLRRSSTLSAGANVPAASRMCALALAPRTSGRAPKSASAPIAAAVRREMIGKARLMKSLRLSGTKGSGEEERLDGGKTLRRFLRRRVTGVRNECEPRLGNYCGELLTHPASWCVFRPMQDERGGRKGTQNGAPIVSHFAAA